LSDVLCTFNGDEMSNHLRELLDCDEIMAGECPSYDLETRVKIASKQVNESAGRAVCFYLGDSRDIAAIDSPSLGGITVDLPFETCWFEFDFCPANKSPIVFGVMADAAKPGEAWLAVFARINHQWNYLFTGLTEDNMRAMTADDDMESVLPEFYRLALGAIRTALCAMKCVNIERVEHKPDEKLQKAREKRGKKPLFSFWTLAITIPNATDARNERGGTHSSPRLHLRRGHPREYRPGLFCWVQPHAVGNKKLGIVHKDYAAQYRTAPVHNV
jgi:hypothetical protein